MSLPSLLHYVADKHQDSLITSAVCRTAAARINHLEALLKDLYLNEPNPLWSDPEWSTWDAVRKDREL